MPAELAALVAKMMAKDPDRRFQTPGEVAQALKPFFKARGVSYGAWMTKVSHLDQAVAGRREMEVSPVPTEPATGTGEADCPVPAGDTARCSEGLVGKLVRVRRNSRRSSDAVKPKPGPPRRRRCRGTCGRLAGDRSDFAWVGDMVLSIMVYTITDKARTKISADEKIGEVQLEHKTRDGGSVKGKGIGPGEPFPGSHKRFFAPEPRISPDGRHWRQR